jgi:hypothetical protein
VPQARQTPPLQTALASSHDAPIAAGQQGWFVAPHSQICDPLHTKPAAHAAPIDPDAAQHGCAWPPQARQMLFWQMPLAQALLEQQASPIAPHCPQVPLGGHIDASVQAAPVVQQGCPLPPHRQLPLTHTPVAHVPAAGMTPQTPALQTGRLHSGAAQLLQLPPP